MGQFLFYLNVNHKHISEDPDQVSYQPTWRLVLYKPTHNHPQNNVCLMPNVLFLFSMQYNKQSKIVASATIFID